MKKILRAKTSFPRRHDPSCFSWLVQTEVDEERENFRAATELRSELANVALLKTSPAFCGKSSATRLQSRTPFFRGVDRQKGETAENFSPAKRAEYRKPIEIWLRFLKRID